MSITLEEMMRPSQVQKKLRQITNDFLQDLFDPDPVPIVTDPATHEEVVDIRKVCEKLGLDPEREMDKLLTDPVLSEGIRFFNRR
jgi:tryptophanase